jgi:2-iminobutanoate/2-iminopropanoate deaminase
MVRTINVGSSVAAYSHATVSGGLVFTSGMTPHDPDTGAVRGGTIEEQTRLSLALLERVLAAAGTDTAHLLQVQVHLDDIDADFAGFDRVYKEMIPAPHPPRATVGSHLPGYRIELTAIAALPED